MQTTVNLIYGCKQAGTIDSHLPWQMMIHHIFVNFTNLKLGIRNPLNMLIEMNLLNKRKMFSSYFPFQIRLALDSCNGLILLVILWQKSKTRKYFHKSAKINDPTKLARHTQTNKKTNNKYFINTERESINNLIFFFFFLRMIQQNSLVCFVFFKGFQLSFCNFNCDKAVFTLVPVVIIESDSQVTSVTYKPLFTGHFFNRPETHFI